MEGYFGHNYFGKVWKIKEYFDKNSNNFDEFFRKNWKIYGILKKLGCFNKILEICWITKEI